MAENILQRTDSYLEGEETLDNKSLNNLKTNYPNISIKFSRDTYSLYELKRKLTENIFIVIDPEFQRENVWSHKQNSELIESIIMGIPIPIIYFFEDEKGVRQVVDGRQRLTCITKFMNNKFKLSDLNILGEYNTYYFKDLPPVLQSKIEDYQVTVYTVQPPTPERVKFDIFDRVNRGGTQLNNQEMRNALYLGKSTELLKRLAKSRLFILATGGGVPTARMKDRYMILRYLGFYLYRTDKIDVEYKSDIDDFLANVMKAINKFSDEEVEQLEQTFESAMRNCHKVLGKDGFRFDKRSKVGTQKRPINMGLFEILAYLFSFNINLDKIGLIELKKKIDLLKQDMDEQGILRIIDSNVAIKYRFEAVEKMLEGLL
ncbi:MAG: DUF262 domain-containing protein [Alphaproteobacteria bacterium]|nr:DUF262 domain-containing protein [Alphaproteobacteria bacterium]